MTASHKQMVLCFVCLIENRDEPNKAATYVQGTSVCREHLFALREVAAAQQQPQVQTPDAGFDPEKVKRQLEFLKDNETLLRSVLGTAKKARP